MPHLRRSLLLAGGAALAAAPALARPRRRRLYSVLEAIVAAWRKQDVEGVLAHVTDDIIWRNSSGYAPPLVGKAAMRTALQGMAAQIARDDWRNFDFAESRDRLFVEGVDEFWLKSWQHVAIPYAAVFEFRGALIREWREYYDGRISLAMKGGAPITDEVKTMISRPPV